jgi:hypothetical protein
MIEIVFVASISAIKTTVDGGINLTLSIPETDSETVKKLFDSRNQRIHCGLIPEPDA